MPLGDAILLIVILLVSVVLHENAHGWTALALGDPTAKSAGRLTLNPIPHLDIFGSIILPALLALTSPSVFGYAKPVPVTPSKLRGGDRTGFAIVALAGPVSNVVIAFVAVILLRTLVSPASTVSDFVPKLLVFTVEVNILLAAFNLVPIPPLDGSRLIRPFLSANGRRTLDRIEPYGFLILFVLLIFLDQPFFRVINLIRSFIVRLLPL